MDADLQEPEWLITRDQYLIKFEKDGKAATIDIVDGKVVYGGDLEVDVSARLLFDWFAQAGPGWLAEKFQQK